MASVRTVFVPRIIEPSRLRGATVVVIDQLRASTTICAALHAGAIEVVPFLNVEDTRAALDRTYVVTERAPRPLLGGERGGVLIPGFDLDNSPRTYTRERVEDQYILFTTTNGTAAVHAAREASCVFAGCLGNLSVVVDALHETLVRGGDVVLLCAGTGGELTLEDVLAVGAMVHRLAERAINERGAVLDIDDASRIASQLWVGAQGAPGGVLKMLLASRGGKNLCDIGFRADVEFCSEIDNVPVLAWLTPLGSFVDAAKWE